MKIYDIISHRSYEVDPEDVNVYATRKSSGHFIWLHECAAKYKLPYGTGQICPSEKVWKKIANEHRTNW